MIDVLDRYKSELIANTKVVPGRVMVKAVRRTLQEPHKGFLRFTYFLGKKYTDTVPRSRLATSWRNIIVFLKNRYEIEHGELFKFVTAGDDKVRKNHRLLDGLILHRLHPALNPKAPFNILPPLDPNCRCVLVRVSKVEAGRLLRYRGLKWYMTRPLPKGATGYLYKSGGLL